jgi:hypothetical protein
VYFDVVFANPFLTLLPDALQLSLLLILSLVNLLFSTLLSVNDLIAELQHLLHQLCVFGG